MFTRSITICLMIFSFSSQAGTVNFLSNANEQVDGDMSFELDLGSRVLRVCTTDGVLNRTGRSFGVNALGGADDSDAIDGALRAESITLSFNAADSLHSIQLAGFGRNDVATLQLGVLERLLDRSGIVDLGNYALAADTSFSISHLRGNGFSLNGLSFSPLEITTSTAATAPDAAAFMLISMVLFWMYSVVVQRPTGLWGWRVPSPRAKIANSTLQLLAPH